MHNRLFTQYLLYPDFKIRQVLILTRKPGFVKPSLRVNDDL
ncbi:MAG TPA: hypothetical protein VKA34_03850 [Balneolales bacterium]|nr:hypothetical protein [Balneolales bacterium]